MAGYHACSSKTRGDIDGAAVTILINIFIAAYLIIAWAWHLPATTFLSALVRPLLPLIEWCGLWQDWSMFAPDPPTSRRDLQVFLTLQSGDAILWEPPRVETLSRWRAFVRFRYQEYASTLLCRSERAGRAALAEYLLRKYDLEGRPPLAVVFTYTHSPIPNPGEAAAAVAPTQVVFDIYTPRRNDS